MEIKQSQEEIESKRPELSIDEFTMSFTYPAGKDFSNLHPITFIEALIEASELKVFGTLVRRKTNLQGYNTTFEFDGAEFVTFAYHSEIVKNGIAFKISATSLANYLRLHQAFYDEEIESYYLINKLLSAADKHGLIPKLSRIDIAADFIDFGDEYETSNIDKLLDSKDLIIKSKQKSKKTGKEYYSQNRTTHNSIKNDGVVNTIYIGKKNSRTGFLRIYNKKVEQISKFGRNLKLAQECKSWTRLESVLKQDYSIEFTKHIRNVENTKQFVELLATFFNKRYTFFDKTNNKTLFSKYLEQHNNLDINIRTKNFRHNDIDKIVASTIDPNGQFQSILFKLRAVEGTEATLEYLKQALEFNYYEYEPSESVSKFAKCAIKNKDATDKISSCQPQPNQEESNIQ